MCKSAVKHLLWSRGRGMEGQKTETAIQWSCLSSVDIPAQVIANTHSDR